MPRNNTNDIDTQAYEKRPADFMHSVEISGVYVSVNGKFLFLQCASHKSEAGAWGVPAGKLELSESALEAAKRELYEETGIETSNEQLQFVGLLYIRKPDIDYIYHLFGVDLPKKPPIHLSPEHTTHAWVSKQEVENLPLMKGARQALDFYCRKHPSYAS